MNIPSIDFDLGEEITMLRDTGIVKWAEHVPPLRTFSSATFAEAAEAAGFECLRVYGIGVVVHPVLKTLATRTYPSLKYRRTSAIRTSFNWRWRPRNLFRPGRS